MKIFTSVDEDGQRFITLKTMLYLINQERKLINADLIANGEPIKHKLLTSKATLPAYTKKADEYEEWNRKNPDRPRPVLRPTEWTDNGIETGAPLYRWEDWLKWKDVLVAPHWKDRFKD